MHCNAGKDPPRREASGTTTMQDAGGMKRRLFPAPVPIKTKGFASEGKPPSAKYVPISTWSVSVTWHNGQKMDGPIVLRVGKVETGFILHEVRYNACCSRGELTIYVYCGRGVRAPALTEPQTAGQG